MSEEKLGQLVEELSQLTVLDMSKLKKMLEEKWDVTAAAAAPVMVAGAMPAGGDAGGESDSTDFLITLEESPADKKIAVIKIVREVTGLGLKEAKDLVEAAPKAIKDSAPKAEAEEIQKKLQETGAKVSLKGL
ncbi:MAG: 50S ribosomal protein L7/L12 [Simkaniaceae bacterium]|nr:50S ribosomal protein L7/L12 [Simkaniaceae bacterium]